MRRWRFLSGMILLVLVLSAVAPLMGVWAQEDIPSIRARNLLNQLTPEEKIGQLFLVTFTGTTVDETSQIYDLITNHHIGGVVLLRSNDNFTAAPDVVYDAYRLIGDLQNIEWDDSQMESDPITGQDRNHKYIPLFTGISQEGDGYPYDQIFSGVTTLPNQMAIGATWQPALAELTGEVMGSELAAMGFNLYFGPSLDVLESPNDTGGAELGTRTFGGDPYWAGKMGQAYISGLHRGSNNTLVVVAKHFPGRGSADRSSSAEAATVRKSLEQLQQIELAPFFAVTGNAPDEGSTTDALLVSHIRYQGFQGNIRATTKPVSLDASALSQILSLPAFVSWRQGGGLIISDDLGSQSIRRFYDPGGQGFVARTVVRDAFLAGNDLLYLGNIQSTDSPDNYSTVLNILDFFVQKYREDAAFAQRVDESVQRILTVKFELYINFLPSLVTPTIEELANIGNSESITFEVARQAATLISPDSQDLDTILPAPPGLQDWIVFLTDDRQVQQCSTCPLEPVLAVDALQNAVLHLYGPGGGGEVTRNRLTSFSFTNLAMILPGGEGDDTLEAALQQADWVVIALMDLDPLQPRSQVVYRFLSEREELLRNKKIVMFAFGAPYYLDATDISKLSAYYGLFSKSEHFQDIAARLLFQEITPIGSLPVSVPGIGYDLLSATAPDPNQVIGLYLDLPPVPTPSPGGTPEPTPSPNLKVGDTLNIYTNVILDHNQNPVPDGTTVRFRVSLSGETGIIQQYEAETYDGVARISFGLERPGLIEIQAVSEPAITSVVLKLDVTTEGVSITVIAPTASQIVDTPTIISPTPDGDNGAITQRDSLGFGNWLMAIVLLSGIVMLIYWLVIRLFSPQWGLRWALASFIGGLLPYNYISLGLPGGEKFIKLYGLLGILLLVLCGAGLGLLGGWLWYLVLTKKRKNKADQQ